MLWAAVSVLVFNLVMVICSSVFFFRLFTFRFATNKLVSIARKCFHPQSAAQPLTCNLIYYPCLHLKKDSKGCHKFNTKIKMSLLQIIIFSIKCGLIFANSSLFSSPSDSTGILLCWDFITWMCHGYVQIGQVQVILHISQTENDSSPL